MNSKKVLVALSTALAVLVMMVLPFLISCAQPSQAPAPSQAPSPSAAAAKVWNLRYHTNTPPSPNPQTDQGHGAYAKSISDATGGRVKVTVYPASTLVKYNECYDAVVAGAVDMAWGFTGFFPGQFGMTDLMSLPLIGVTSGVTGARSLWDLYQKYPEAFGKEFSEVKLLSFTCASPTELGTSKKAIRVAGDLKGLNIRTPGGPPTELMKALGANPMLMDASEVYTSMDKGVVDGYLLDWQVQESFKMYEVAKYFTDINFSIPVFWIILNKNTWNSMPPDVQQQVMSVSGERAASSVSQVWDNLQGVAREATRARPGKEVINISPEEYAKWSEFAKPIWDAYITKLEAKGLPGRAAFNELLSNIKKYTK